MGVAGLTLAVRLGRAGWNVLLLERDREAPKSGYLIDLSGPGYRAAERLDLVQRLESISYPVPQIVWLDQRGATVAQLQRGNFERAVGSPLLTLMRADLQQVLLATLSRSTQIRFGKTVEDIDLRRARNARGLCTGG
jgi:2-polyprenyl-6-methoxyphenol hydroxylase-like FAD-dependent oxidoreductase